jgi:hypothetical protein
LKNHWILLRILSLNCDWLYNIYIDTESAESIFLFFFFKA